MSDRTDQDFLDDIREALNRIEIYTAKMTYADFLTDTKTQDAVIRNIEIIGEAAKNVSIKLRGQHPHVPWRGMAGIRDKLLHHYFGINLDIVWHVVKSELPDVALQIEEIVKSC